MYGEVEHTREIEMEANREIIILNLVILIIDQKYIQYHNLIKAQSPFEGETIMVIQPILYLRVVTD